MELADLFDILIKQRQIALSLELPQANSLRVSLLRKFKDYKDQMEKLGWLAEDLAVASVSMEYQTETKTAKFFLRPRKRVAISYSLLETPNGSE